MDEAYAYCLYLKSYIQIYKITNRVKRCELQIFEIVPYYGRESNAYITVNLGILAPI